MKLYWRRNVFGWVMTGLVGKGAKWFFGFSRVPASSVFEGGKRHGYLDGYNDGYGDARRTAGALASEPADWHAPGIGEVHNADHSLMLFCTKANPDPEGDPDYLPDDELAARIAAMLNASA